MSSAEQDDEEPSDGTDADAKDVSSSDVPDSNPQVPEANEPSAIADVPPSLTAADLIPDQALEKASGDKFRHEPLAERIADLVTNAELPLNLALFGAWGSGKSSLTGLITEKIKVREGRVAVVYYDAWKYGGEALRRNFISRSASELGFTRDDPQWHEFHRGLYESRRRAEVERVSVWQVLWPIVWRFAFLFVLLNVAFAVAVGAASVFTDKDFFGEIGRVLPRALVGSGVVAVAIAAANALFITSKVEIEESAPSADEQFSDTFRKLIRTVREGLEPETGVGSWPRRSWAWIKGDHLRSWPQKPERIVFLIDELDRCTEEDVVTTLVAIRTFLDEAHCVFVVAADRAVLETALDRAAEQATPTNENSPYYSTAGAFLDKVFQHQISVPPLRGRRLTKFARDLAAGQEGLWRELRDSGPTNLDSVIYALIPSHVRSPRRVKVLMNNFATTTRLAQSRGIEWPKRAEEIAKLTTLRTEFPGLADDLLLEPRLPQFLLDETLEEAQTERALPLVKRHSLVEVPGQDSEEPAKLIGGGLPENESPHDDEATTGKRAEMRKRQRVEIRRYLERVADIPGPRRDLLYLEAAGAAVDLEDAELGDDIEDLAPDRPKEIAGLLEDRTIQERVSALRLLADISDDLVAKERVNVMTALTELVLVVGSDLPRATAVSLTKSIKLFEQQTTYETEHLPGVLEVALRANDEALTDDILERDALWDDIENVERLLPRWNELPALGQSRLEHEVASHIAHRPELLRTLLALPDDRAGTVLSAGAIRDAIEQAYAGAGTTSGQAALDQLVETLLDATLAAPVRQALLGDALGLLDLNEETSYESAKAKRDLIRDALPEAAKAEWLLSGWIAAPVTDFGTWSKSLGMVEPAERNQEAQAVISKLFAEGQTVITQGDDSLADLVTNLMRFCNLEAGTSASFIPAVNDAIELPWGGTPTALAERSELHAAAKAAQAAGDETAYEIDGVLAADLARQLGLPRTPQIMGAIGQMAATLSTDGIVTVAEQLHTVDAETQRDEAVLEVTLRASLAREVRQRGQPQWSGSELAVSYSDDIRHLVLRLDAGVLFEHWLLLGPPSNQVAAVLKVYARKPTGGILSSLGQWASSRTKKTRTSLVSAILGSLQTHPEFIAEITKQDVVQMALARRLVALIDRASTVDGRLRFANKTDLLKLQSEQARVLVADTAIKLLKGSTKSDVSVAIALIGGLAASPPKQPSLTKAVARAAEKHSYKFSGNEVRLLTRAGIEPPKKSVGKKIRERFGL